MESGTEAYKAIILPIIIKYLPNSKVLLYGSRARQDDKPGSDIDIALDLGKKIDPTILSNIKGDLEESNLPINYDIIDLYTASEQMQANIRKDGVLWQQ